MDRRTSDRSILDKFCTNFCSIVQKHCRYIIVSGFVAISSGRTRGTEDIDMIIPRIDIETFTKLHEELTENDFVCVQSDDAKAIFEYLDENICVRYTLVDKPIPEMEVKFAKDELDEFQLKTRQKIPLTGLDIWFSSIDMNIAFKEEYLKSEKDIEDAKHLRTVYEEEIDEKDIKKIKNMIRRLRL